MKNELEFLGVITARFGSKTIPHKNIKNLAGKPLITYTFNAVKNSKLLDRCIVSTDDPDIVKLAKKFNIETPFIRPKELATDEASSIDVLIHAMKFLQRKENYLPNFVVTLQPTSPLRTGEDIDIAITFISENPEADSLVSVIEVPHIFHPQKIMFLEGNYLMSYMKVKEKKISRRQDLNVYYARNGAAIYITHYSLLIDKKRILGEKCIPYHMPKERSIDIDDYFDWRIAELLLKSRIISNKKKKKKKNN